MQENKHIQFVFIGDGVCLTDIKKQVKNKQLSNVKFIPRKPLKDMAAFFSVSDVLLVTLANKPIFEITMPAKTQAYMACGKPMLIAKKGVDIKFLEEQGCALIVEPEKPEKLAGAARQLMHFLKKKETKWEPKASPYLKINIQKVYY